MVGTHVSFNMTCGALPSFHARAAVGKNTTDRPPRIRLPRVQLSTVEALANKCLLEVRKTFFGVFSSQDRESECKRERA